MDPRSEIVAALRELSASDFITQHLFDRVPYLFDGDRTSFLNWKVALAKAIEVDPACITFVGSCAIGISLDPSKGFKTFDSTSDEDVAIISYYHFTVAWRFLRTQGYRRTHVNVRTRTAWDEHVTRFIYWGTIATDRLLGVLPFGKQWLTALGEMSRISPTIGKDINLRIYSDY